MVVDLSVFQLVIGLDGLLSDAGRSPESLLTGMIQALIF